VATTARLSNRLDAVLLGGCLLLSLIALGLSSDKTEPIASALRRTVVAPLVGLQQSAERWRTAWSTIEQRQLAVDSVALQRVRLRALDVENVQLRKLLGLGSRLQWGFVPAEALHSTQPIPNEDLIQSLTLTAGSTVGIKKYNPVVSLDGLVGQIQSADPSTSTAILFTHPDFRASAMSGDGRTFGIVYPHQASRADERSEAYFLELRGVTSRDTLRAGIALYTSGLGGIFPRGILIGTVLGELATREIWTKTYLVRPAVNPAHVTSVLVLSPQRVTEGTGNVWASNLNVDSATRRIASAGDSVERQAALLQAQARRAALDSVKRATIDSVRRALGFAVDVPRDSTRPVVRDTTRVRRDTTPGRRDTATTPIRPRGL
jgi:rod shape-determining protein MreC